MKKRGIFVTNPGGDHGAAMLFQGLIENDWELFVMPLDDHKYEQAAAAQSVILGWLPGYERPSAWSEEQPWGDICNAIFVESTRNSAVAVAQRVKAAHPGVPLILHDGEDRPWADLAALDLLKPDWYLKREWGNSGRVFKMPENTLAYPFSCPSQVLDVPASEPFDVFCVMGNSHPNRVELVQYLKANLLPEVLANSKIGIAGEDIPYYPWREYIGYLKGCRVAVQMHGCGIDTAGFWEAACCAEGVLRDLTIMELPMPDGPLSLHCAPYSSFEELLNWTLAILAHPLEPVDIVARLADHSCKARAAQMLKTIGLQ